MSDDKPLERVPAVPHPVRSAAAELAVAKRRWSQHASLEQDLSPRFFLAVLAQWWKVLLPLTVLLTAVSTGLVLYFFEPQYRAAAWLQIRGTQPFVAFPEQELADRDAAKKFVQTQIELLRSPLILGRVMSQPDIDALPELQRKRDPVDWLARKGLMISPKGDSDLLEVAYAGPDPENAARLVNEVVRAYFALRKEKRDEQAQAVILLLEDEKVRRAEEIRALQAELRQLQKQVVASDPSQAASAFAGGDIVISENPLKNIQENLSRAQVDHKVLEAQVAALEGSLEAAPTVPEALVDREVDHRLEVQDALAELNRKRAMLNQTASASAQAAGTPRYTKLEQEIQQLEATVKSLRDTARPQVREEMQAVASVERREDLERLRTELETQRLVVQSLQDNYEGLVQDLSQSGGTTVDLRFKQAELERKQQVLDRISQRAAQLSTEMYAPPRVEPIQDASAPAMPLATIPWKQLLAALLGSLALPYALCALWERSVRRVTSAEQLQQESSLPVVGEIARLPLRSPHAPQGGFRAQDSQLSLFEESIDSLRTALFLAHEPEDIRVLAVSSAVSGEGKSSVAAQLAVSLARASGRATLLIDGDMRSPDLHRIFQIELEPGLASVLEGSSRLRDAINRNWSEHVHILPAGKLTRSPHKLLGNDHFRRLLEQVRLHYRYVIIDTPPILAASEAMVMARDADGTLICAMRDISREGHIQMTYERLVSVGAKPIGTVLSGVPTRQYARRYGSYAYSR